MPASATVEELSAARAHEGEDMLEVGCGARRGPERCWIERAAARGEEDKADETATDLEAARADVLVRQTVAREVEDRPQQERRGSRPAGGTGRGARRHVKRDDHGYRPSRWARETRADPNSRAWRFRPVAGAQPALVVAEEPEGDTHYRFVYSDQRKPCPAASRGTRLLLCVPFAGLFDLAPASGAVRSRSEPHARPLGAPPRVTA